MTSQALVDGYDLVILDLDGVVYVGDRPVPGAVEAVTALHERQIRIAYATNNASRRASEVAELLTDLGIRAGPDEVLTSAVAAAAALAERHPARSPVLVVGAEALRAAVRDADLLPVGRGGPGTQAVVQGYGPAVGWRQLAEACVALRAGADWVATNTDATLPSPRGPLPGNGALVAALRTAVGREPDLVVGKPAPTLFSTAARRAGAARPLVVGDRLDTDIEGAVRAGMDSLLVLTGVASPEQLLAAPEQQRPTYVATDLSGLVSEGTAVRVSGAGPHLGGWSARRRPGELELAGHGSTLDALRALCVAAWSAHPAESRPAETDPAQTHPAQTHPAPSVPARAAPAWTVTGSGRAAIEALRRLGLAPR